MPKMQTWLNDEAPKTPTCSNRMNAKHAYVLRMSTCANRFVEKFGFATFTFYSINDIAEV